MLAYAMHLTAQGANHVELRPDGEHGKRFDIRSWLEAEGFTLTPAGGRTAYCGVYDRTLHKVTVQSRAGDGDVVATIEGRRIVAECKGGVVNSKHAGQKSKLRRAVLEAVGQLLCRPQGDERQVAVVPDAPESRKWAKRIALRAWAAGIEVALVDRKGGVEYVSPA